MNCLFFTLTEPIFESIADDASHHDRQERARVLGAPTFSIVELAEVLHVDLGLVCRLFYQRDVGLPALRGVDDGEGG